MARSSKPPPASATFRRIAHTERWQSCGRGERVRRREPASGGSAARTIVAGPDQEVDQLVLVLLSAINLARRSIRIATPYFLPDEQLVTALQLAVLRGVDVHLVLPSHNNHRLVAWAAQTHIRPLLQSGCHLWRSAPPFDHSKLMTIDGSWSLIGSANWDMRSLRLNFELTVEFYDTDLAGKLAGIIDARCVQPITLEEIDKGPLPVRLRDAAARLAMPYIRRRIELRSLLKVASYNIHKCRGVDGVTRPDRIIRVIQELAPTSSPFRRSIVVLAAVAGSSIRPPSSVRPECSFWCNRTFLTATAGTATRCSCAENRYPTGDRA